MRNTTTGITPYLLTALLAAWLILLPVSGCTSPQGGNDTAGAQVGESPGHEHGAAGEEGDDHGDTEQAASMPLDRIAELQCEHGVPAYQCDPCRYEVGVVKVARSLLEGDAVPAPLIRTCQVSRQPVTAGLEVTGEVQLNDSAAVHISPRIPGIVESVAVDFGHRVQRGDVLFRITSAELGRALGAYERSRAMVALSERNYERERGLFERRISSEQEMIAANMEYEAHRTELVAARQQLQVYGLSGQDLADMADGGPAARPGSLPIRAPISGTIIHKHAVTGELVQPGEEVMLLADLSTVWVWADIYEQDLTLLLAAERKGPVPASISVQAFAGRFFPGLVDYVGATMDERTRTVKVRATVENPEGILRPGMFCEIRISAGESEEVLAVPRSALLSDEGHDFVFLHWKDDYFVRRAVSRGREFMEQVEILGGLEPGELVATDGAFLLKSDVLREKMGAGCAD